MVNRLVKFLMIKLGKTTPEDLTVKACIDKGMKVGGNCHGLTSTTIDFAHCWLIQIGDNVTFAPQAYLLAHDASTKRYLDYTKIAKIIIEDNVFVGARALIMPGVTIGTNAVIAAGSVVTKSVPEGCIVAGNPARVIGKTNDYIEKHKREIETSHVYDWRWTIGGGITSEMCNQMFEDLNNSFGYVK